MPVYEGEVSLRYPYVINVENEEEAAHELLLLAKEDFPEATGFSVSGVKMIRENSIG